MKKKMTQKNKVYTGRAATTVAMTFALLLCALCAYVLLGATSTIHKMVGEVHISVEISDTAALNSPQIEAELLKIEGVSAVDIREAEAAQKNYSEFVGIDLEKHLGGIILPKIAVVTIAPENAQADGVNQIKKTLANEEWVQSVHLEESIPEQVTKNLGLIERFAMYVAGVIGLAAFIIVYLGIRLSVGAQFNGYGREAHGVLVREAYRWAWVQGLVSSVGSMGLLLALLGMAKRVLPELSFSMEIVPLLGAGAVVVSILSSLLFTFFAVSVQRGR